MSNYKPEDYVKYRMRKANETIAETTVLIENKYWNTAINRMYYACFYAVGALLVKYGVETTSHSGTRQKFGQLFILTGKFRENWESIILNYLRKNKRATTTIFLILMKIQFSGYTNHLKILLRQLKN